MCVIMTNSRFLAVRYIGPVLAQNVLIVMGLLLLKALQLLEIVPVTKRWTITHFTHQFTQSDYSIIKVAKVYILEMKSYNPCHTYAMQSANNVCIHVAFGLKLAEVS